MLLCRKKRTIARKMVMIDFLKSAVSWMAARSSRVGVQGLDHCLSFVLVDLEAPAVDEVENTDDNNQIDHCDGAHGQDELIEGQA